MNRKIMDGLSYGFYFVIICIIFLVIYLVFFKNDTPKSNDKIQDSEESQQQIVNESIKLNKYNVSLDIGGSFDLKVTLVPSNGDEKILFSSSDLNVVTVDENGQISAKSAGSAKITVKVEGSDLEAVCDVVVSDKTIVAEKIFVKEEKVILKVGQTYQFDVTIVPINAVDKTVNFVSNNTSIITVDENGFVTSLRDGSTSVIISSKSNPSVQTKVVFVVQKK